MRFSQEGLIETSADNKLPGSNIGIEVKKIICSICHEVLGSGGQSRP